jgi:hypothetical protein
MISTMPACSIREIQFQKDQRSVSPATRPEDMSDLVKSHGSTGECVVSGFMEIPAIMEKTRLLVRKN